MEQTLCQSCGMPMTNEYYSTNTDGTANTVYCSYCYKDGQFTKYLTMDEMILQCAKFVDEFNKDSEKKFTKAEAIEQMKLFFPSLERWKK